VPSYTALADFEVFLCCKTIFIVHAQNKKTAIDFYMNTYFCQSQTGLLNHLTDKAVDF
jgi:hypothetical protein